MVGISSLHPQDPVKTKEEVTVFNVQVPIRVFFNKKPVDNLTKEDFTLFEDNQQQKINAFYLIKKKIKIPRQDITGTTVQTQPPPDRYFVLVFRLTDFNREVEKGLDYLFKNILRKNDQLLIFANDKTLFINRLVNKVETKLVISKVIRDQSMEAQADRAKNVLRIKDLLDKAKLNMGWDPAQNALQMFLKKYLKYWREYKRRFLVPDMKKYYNFSKHLEKIDKQKWVISFYQMEMFPKIKVSSDFMRAIEDRINMLLQGRSEDIPIAREMSKILQTLTNEMNAAQDFPSEEISNLFYKTGATFHSILFPVIKSEFYQDIEIKRISTNVQNSLREITRKTGGKLLFTNDLESALGKIIEVEDICYMLSYAPENYKKIGKIKVKVPNKNYKVLYDKNIRSDYINDYLKKVEGKNPSLRLEQVKFENRTLSLKISNFKREPANRTAMGRLFIHIQLKDKDNNIVYEKSNDVKANKKSILLSIQFNELKKGLHFITVDVKDLLTGKASMEFLQPNIK
jgi:hypothetical protein